MTIQELITIVNAEKPNSFSNDKLTEFINEVESDVVDFLGDTAVGWDNYVYAQDKNEDLIVPQPYDRMYKYYLMAKIDYALEEYQSYANNIDQYNSDWIDYKDMVIHKGILTERLPSRIKNIF